MQFAGNCKFDWYHIKIVTGTKMESQGAGRMGYGTTEVGDLVIDALDS